MYSREKNLPGFSQVFLVILKLFFKVEFFCIADDLIVEISKFFERRNISKSWIFETSVREVIFLFS